MAVRLGTPPAYRWGLVVSADRGSARLGLFGELLKAPLKRGPVHAKRSSGKPNSTWEFALRRELIRLRAGHSHRPGRVRDPQEKRFSHGSFDLR
jgi:hypothetical protein